MARFFSTTASSAGKRSLAFIGRAASRLINTFQSAVHSPEPQQTALEAISGENTPSVIQETESVIDADEGEQTSTEEDGTPLVIATYLRDN